MHMLIILKPEYKITSPEIPNPNKFPDLYEKVAKCMMHGPCGDFNNSYPCMREGKCKKRYP